MDGIHEMLNAIYSSATDDVLATVVKVEGSAYRKEGASMLLRGNGITIGMISAGCLETDLTYRAQEVREQGAAKTFVYDMRDEDDLSWGQGAGCNGVIHVLLEPIDASLRKHLCRMKFYLDSGKRVTVVKRLKEDVSVSDYWCTTDDGQLFGKWHGGIPVQLRNFIEKMHSTAPKPGVAYVPELSESFYIQSFEPKPRFIVFGAGADAIPLVKLAANAGFSVVVSDWRIEYCTESYFPDADQLLTGFPSKTVAMLNLSSNDYVLLLTHHFQRDKELLHYLEGKKLKYLGILGPRSRTERLFDGKGIPPQISSPAGIRIGAEGPEEIAVSIVAELIQQKRSKKAAGILS